MRLDRDPLDLIERNLVAGAIVKLGSARTFVRRHRLSVFKRTAGPEIGGDARRPKHMAAELDLESGFGRPPADHLVGIDIDGDVQRLDISQFADPAPLDR